MASIFNDESVLVKVYNGKRLITEKRTSLGNFKNIRKTFKLRKFKKSETEFSFTRRNDQKHLRDQVYKALFPGETFNKMNTLVLEIMSGKPKPT